MPWELKAEIQDPPNNMNKSDIHIVGVISLDFQGK